MKSIYPCIWFDDQAEPAAKFYESVFKDARILETTPYLTETPSDKPLGSVLTVTIELNGLKFELLNGGPFFKVNEAVSFVIECKDQEEVDYYWEKLSSDPASEQCGWLKDKFGISWQVLPKRLYELMHDADREKATRAMQAMLEMKKIDVAKLEQAAG